MIFINALAYPQNKNNKFSTLNNCYFEGLYSNPVIFSGDEG